MSKMNQNDETTSTYMRNKMRRARTFRMTNGKCFYCGDPLIHKGHKGARDWIFLRPERSKMVQEHKTPVSRAGADSHENYVPSCAACNWYKGQLNLEEYRFIVGLRSGALQHRFWGESPVAQRRDWLICGSAGIPETHILVHNFPDSVAGIPRRRPLHSGLSWRG